MEKSAGAVLFYREENGEIKYLLLKNRGGNWNFPKGLIEQGEKIEQTALRECQEETGLKSLEFIPEFNKTIKYFFRAKYDYQIKERGLEKGGLVLKFATYLLAESKSKDVKLSLEHQDYCWAAYKKALSILLKNKNIQEVLIQANEFLRQIRII